MKKGNIIEPVKTESKVVTDFAPAYTLTIGELRMLIREELSGLATVAKEPLLEDCDGKWLDLSGVSRYLGVTRQCVYKLRKSGKFPKPSFVGTRARWQKHELDSMISDKKK